MSPLKQPVNLLERAAARSQAVLAGLDARSQGELGQFFTPPAVARVMVGMPRLPDSGVLRVLERNLLYLVQVNHSCLSA